MTLSDSEAMKLPAPIVRDTSCILVSKKRLISMLGHMGYMADTDGQYLLSMIHSLWQEANDYASLSSDDVKFNAAGKPEDGNDTTSSRNDDDESDASYDLVELGTLKWILYGFPATQPAWWSSFCMPCGMTSSDKALQKRQNEKAQEEHPVQVSSMKRRHGELVRHDVVTCMLCRDATGCPEFQEQHGRQAGQNDAPSDEGEEQGLSPGFHSSSPDNGTHANLLLEPADDVSCIYASDDSCVEVSALPTLLAVEHLVEEKMRL